MKHKILCLKCINILTKQCRKWKFTSSGIHLTSETRIYRQRNGNINGYSKIQSKSKAVPLHAMEVLGGRECIAPTDS
jgi:hypothetical protein